MYNRLHLAKRYNFTFHYIDDLIHLGNKYFEDHVDEIYPYELDTDSGIHQSTA